MTGTPHESPLPPSRRRLLLASLMTALPAPARAQGAPDIVAVYGDSMAQGVGMMLNQALLRDRRFRVVNRGRVSTGLGQPSPFNWIEAVRRSLDQDHPGYAVMMFGANDRLPMRQPGGSGWIRFGSDAWIALYRTRLDALLQAVADAAVPVVWCGNPIAREPRYSSDMRLLNAIYREAIEARGQTFLDTWPIFADAQGRYADALATPRGTLARLRADDGIHMTPTGYGLIARRVLARIEELHATSSRAAPRAVLAAS